jgi:predicted AAA+ superfamily ATPase
MIIYRYLQDKIKSNIGKRKIQIIYGPRQVGKTTLVKEFLSLPNSVYYNCDQDETRLLFEEANLEKLATLVKKYDTVVIDEAQKVNNIGLSLKIIFDNYPDKNYIVTGSSSFDLAKSVSEPLTGRFFSYTMFPIAEMELAKSKNPIELRESLENRLIYGSYPEVITAIDLETKKEIIKNITDNYLFKDILSQGVIRNPDDLRRLLQAIALQSGNEVSLSELAKTLDVDKNTVKKYLEICEKLYILFSLSPYVSNKRKSISMLKKYFFYDLGIRNSLINNFNPIVTRNDVGSLWENYMILERLKYNSARNFDPMYYFFRSYEMQEIDLFEDEGGVLNGYEFKFSKDGINKATKELFENDIKGKELKIVNRDNYSEFIGT